MLNDRASRPYSYRRTQSLRRFNYEGVNRPTVQPHQLINIPLNEPHKALCTLFVTFNDIDDPEKQITTEHVFNNTNPRQYPQTRKVVYRSNGKKTRMAESPAFIDESDTEKSEHKEVSSKNGSNGSFAKMIVQEVSMTYTGMRGASPPPPQQPTRVDVSRPIRVETNLALPMPSPRSRSNTHGSLREYLSSYDRRVSDAETVDRISQNGRHETEFPVRIAYDRSALSPPVYSVPITTADSRATTHRLGSSLGSLITETTEQHYRAFSTRRSDMAASPTNVNALAQQFERTAREQRAEAQRTAGKRSPSQVVVVKPNPVYKTSSYGSDSERSLDDQNRVRRVERQVYSPTDERSVISTTIVDIEPPNYGRRSVTPQFVQETYQVQEEYHTIKTYTPGRPRSRGDERVHIREVSRETQPIKEIIKEDVQYSRSTSGGPSRAQVSPVKTVVEKFESHLEESTRERRPPMVDQIREEIMVQSRTSQHTREEDERIRRAREEEKRREEERRLLEQRERRMDGRKYETTIIEEQLIEEIRIRRRKDDSDLRNKQEEERLRREQEELERIRKQEEERRREELYIREEQIRIEEERRYREELQIIENRKRIEKEQKEKEEEHQRKQREEEERREQGRIEAEIQRKEKERAERQRQEELRVREELRIQEEIRIEEERRLRILEENKRKAEEEKERSRREEEQRRRDERERQRQAELEEIRRQNEKEEEERKRKEEEKREAEKKQREEERRKREEEKKKEEERRQKELWERQEERKRKEEEIILEEERREKERQQRAEERRLQREEQERKEEEQRRIKAEENIQLEEARRREAAERRVPESKFEDERRMTEVTIIEETRRIEEDRVRKERDERDELRRKEEEDARKKREEEREREKKREAERRKLEEIRIQEERAKWEEKRRIEEERRAEERRREEERRRQEMEKTKEKKPEPIAPVKETTEISLDSSMTDDYRSTISARPGFTRNVNTFNSNTSTTSYGPVSGNRVLKFVNEVSSSSLSGLSPFGQHAASSIKESREREKKEMSDLNDRLASYIEKVRFLEAQNRKLGTDLDLLRSRWGKDTSSIRTMYESELVEARKLIAETNNQRDLLEKDIYKLREELAEYRRKYETALSSREADRQTIDDLLQKLSALEAELSLLKRRIANIEDEVSRIKKENQRLMGELTRARQDLDQETLNRIDYQNQVQTLLEEIDFIRRVNDQEIRDLQAMASRDTTSENREYFKNELSSAIRDIRQEYDQISTVNKTDMESWYKLKVQEIQTQSARTNMEQGYAKEEVKRLRTQLGDLRGKLADLEGRNSLLEKQIQELNYQLEDDQRSYESALNDRDAQIRKMREECQALMVELQMLLDTKQTLDAEIAIYRKMLEGEENRAGLRQLVEQVVKTTSLTHSEENESLRTLKGETSSRTSFQRSAKGNVSIQETSADGKYVVLENTHRSREEDIGGWKLKRKIDGKREIVYTLPQNFILRPQKTVKIYARGHGSHGADSLVHEGDDSFGTGSNVQTILFNAAGEERATHIQRSSRE